MRETYNQRIERLRRIRTNGKLSYVQEIRLLWMESPDGLKSLVTRSIIGALVMWIVTNVAVFWYALKFGMQIPLEGVPFLVVVSLMASVIVSIFSAANMGLQAVGRRSKNSEPATTKTSGVSEDQDNKSIRQRLDRQLKSLSQMRRIYTLVTSILNAFVTVSIAAVLFSSIGFFSEVSGHILDEIQTPLMRTVMVMIGLLIMGVFIYFVSTKWRRPLRLIPSYKTTGNIIYFGGLLLVGWLITFAGGTDHLLKVTKFGGGIDVDLHSEQGSFDEASLMLQTNSTLVIWDRKSDEFVWIPLSQVTYMDFSGDPKVIRPEQRSISKRLGF